MKTVHSIEDRSGIEGGSLVPTMGALHAGHLALIRRARALGRPVVVSIFVNPAQFAEDEDVERYPRRLEADREAAAGAGADVVFAPDVETVYPRGAVVRAPPLPAVATEPRLEDACRPGHFAGVCQVVGRLFDLIRPRWAVFGEKDYQQLLVVQAMVEAEGERWPGLEIDAHATLRERDGLAESSRNASLDLEQRARAVGLFQALEAARAAPGPGAATDLMVTTLEAHGLSIDYAVVRDAATLMPIDDPRRPSRALIAAHTGGVRLIDNMPLPSSGDGVCLQ